ncbi:MAG: hypothetical protein IMY67_12255 [Bacteroidetes bacterium]|nr:hypothetical protein [Bacteroidota bacterium]
MNTLEFKNYVTKLKLEYNEWIIRIAHDIYNDNICDNKGHYNDDEGVESIFMKWQEEISSDKTIIDLILISSTSTNETDGRHVVTGDTAFTRQDNFFSIKQMVAEAAFYCDIKNKIDHIIDENRKY